MNDEARGFSIVGREIVYGVSDFVAVINQVVEYSMPTVLIVGELANLKVSKGKWVYFDLKDDEASVRFFGTVYMLPGPLENGMMLEVRGSPRLHPLFGFSVNVQTIRPVGEGSLRKAAQLLEAKLAAEGLFDDDRKRELEYPPARIGLVTSGESAAYADFIKILSDRWSGVQVELADVQVQGERSPGQVVSAVHWFNALAEPPDVLVIIRGGGSADDLAAFSDERVVRAVAASRVPTLVAIGHEIDVGLAELAADRRAATPSNAAEILVPDRREVMRELQNLRLQLADDWYERLDDMRQELTDVADDCRQAVSRLLEWERTALQAQRRLAEALNPAVALARGFAIVRGADGTVIRRAGQIAKGAMIRIGISDAQLGARIESIHMTDAIKKRGTAA